MKLIIVVAFALLAFAIAAPVEPEPPKIVRSEFEQKPEGSYTFGFETDDGTKREEDGQLKEVLDEDNKPKNVVIVRGSYTYINPDGKSETVNYYADENGFNAEGPSIPQVNSRR